MVGKTLTVAAIQMVSSDDVDRNLDSAVRLIREARARAHDDYPGDPLLVVLPENALCFSAKAYTALADNSDRYLETLASICRECSLDLILGSIPLATRPDASLIPNKLRSASLHIDPNGEIVSRYDKMHLFDVDVADGQGAYRESDDFEPGEVPVLTAVGEVKVGLSICYDLRFPGLYQHYQKLGADILTVPAAFTKVTGEAHWETLLRARAIENQCYVIAANQGGCHSAKRETWGHSMIVDPWGRVQSSLEFGEGVCLAQLDLSQIEGLRRKMPVKQHNRF